MARSSNKGKGGNRGRGADPRLFDDEDDHQPLKGPGRRPPKKQGSGWKWRLFKFTVTFGFWSFAAAVVGFTYIWFSLDQRGLLQIPKREPGIMMLANNGTMLAQEGAFFGDAAKIGQLPDYVPNAVIAIEDHRFRSHHGIDPVGLARAVSRNLLARHLVQGGSTLTQQLAKNLFLTQEKTLTRKAQEAVLAIWLESRFSKDEILQLYLNRVYFGSGAYGIEQAAHTFFNKTASELSVMEAARLAASLKAPTNYDPINHPDESTTRAKLVINAMQEQGFLSPIDAVEAFSEETTKHKNTARPPRQYAVDWIDAQLELLVKDYEDSIIIETSIDPVIQANAEKALAARLNSSGEKLSVSQGAVVVMDNQGAVLALVGGKSYEKSQFNRATKAARQPGSAFKAFVYLTAIENGYRPNSIEVDAPIKIGNWSPENYKQKYLGPITLQQAFAQSINTVAVKLMQNLGPEQVAQTAQRLGISSKLGHDASLALGTSEVTPMEMTQAFVTFANGGNSVAPWVVKRITTRDGKVLYQHKGTGLGQVITSANLGQMNQLLRSVVRDGTATKAQFGNWDIGGKTGTSQDYRDAWFVGFTPYLTTGVWLGNDDNTPTKDVTGGSLPAQIWRDVMEPAHKGLKWLPLPGDTTQVAARPAPPEQPENPKGLFDLLFGKSKAAPQPNNGIY